jgi:hypothetical protein
MVVLRDFDYYRYRVQEEGFVKVPFGEQQAPGLQLLESYHSVLSITEEISQDDACRTPFTGGRK